jgi:hypothetical protein
MSQLGTCERGCSENKLELVDAVDHDAVTALASAARTRVDAYLTVTEELATRRPGPQEYEIAYHSLQESARAVLQLYPDDDPRGMPDPDEPAARATTWWCEQCGGIDAPQPCLGICIWRPIEWVGAELYDDQRAQALALRDNELRLRALMRRLVSITPRERHWKLGWRVVQAQAHDSLRNATPLADTRTPREHPGRRRTPAQPRAQ